MSKRRSKSPPLACPLTSRLSQAAASLAFAEASPNLQPPLLESTLMAPSARAELSSQLGATASMDRTERGQTQGSVLLQQA